MTVIFSHGWSRFAAATTPANNLPLPRFRNRLRPPLLAVGELEQTPNPGQAVGYRFHDHKSRCLEKCLAIRTLWYVL